MWNPQTIPDVRSWKLRQRDWEMVALIVAVKLIVIYFGLQAYEAVANARVPSGVNSLQVWNRWDSPGYLSVAQHGYSNARDARFQLVLLPFYPLCVRIIAVLARNYFLSGLIVSTISTLAAGILLQRLTRFDASPSIARRAVWFMLIFPTSFFLHIPYAESLFLALAIGSFYAARVERWAIVGVLGACAGMTRVNGMLLIPCLMIEALQRYRAAGEWRWQWLFTLAPIVGFAVYLFINYHVAGDPLAFLQVQHEHWSKSLDWPWKGLHGSIDLMLRGKPPTDAVIRGTQEIMFVALGLACTIASWLTLRPAYSVWMTLNWLLFTSVGFVLCVPRYTLVMFPIFILLAKVARRQFWAATITSWSLLVLALFIVLFVRGWWVS